MVARRNRPAGLATPAVFKALDLATRSAADPVALAAWFDPAVYGPAARLTWTVRDERDER